MEKIDTHNDVETALYAVRHHLVNMASSQTRPVGWGLNQYHPDFPWQSIGGRPSGRDARLEIDPVV